jgi:hypothetical protein
MSRETGQERLASTCEIAQGLIWEAVPTLKTDIAESFWKVNTNIVVRPERIFRAASCDLEAASCHLAWSGYWHCS